MKFAASVLLAAASSFGVSAYMVVRWIADGKLPLLSAYSTMLSEEQQVRTRNIRTFFEDQSLPQLRNLHFRALTLFCMALTQHPPKISFIQSDDTVERMLLLIIDDLALGDDKRLFKYSLAIMGLYLDDSETEWLPPQLTKSSNVRGIIELLAVIVVAVKLCPGWERRIYKRKNGMVPWSNSELMHMKAADIPAYLDFHEKFIGRNNSLIPQLSSSAQGAGALQVDSVEDADVPSSTGDDGIPVVRWSDGYRATKRRKRHDWYLRLRQNEALWLEANGIGDYVIYARFSKFLSTHPHYRLLIEHMNQITGADPNRIHTEATRLDLSLATICKANPPTMQKCGARRMTDPEEMYRAMVDLEDIMLAGRKTAIDKDRPEVSSPLDAQNATKKREREAEASGIVEV
uniref:Uncharacterized protein n=1 Tax=Grammatophora oceanica TaxID=210454 RepID=A0A7S1VLT5_9STRA|mmetsp:Transcript_50141/g.74861  ORF Transcript_50141/g.74861 Transcript_50141/m.74861 type:complete len:403 (+) Transcript_50141:305-1513(+)